MKRYILTLLLSLPLVVMAQNRFTLQPRIGMNDEKYLFGGIDIAYRINQLEPAAVLTMDKYDAAYFGARICYYFGGNIHIAPLVSYYFKYSSNNESKWSGKNIFTPGYGLRIAREYPQFAADPIIFVQLERTDEFQFTLGIAF